MKINLLLQLYTLFLYWNYFYALLSKRTLESFFCEVRCCLFSQRECEHKKISRSCLSILFLTLSLLSSSCSLSLEDDKFNISKKENNKYKIGSRNTVAIIEEKDQSLILITTYGFEKYDFKIDNINFKVSVAISKEDRKSNKDKNRGVIYKIFRINFLNKKVESGTISDIYKSMNSIDRQKKIFSIIN